MKQHPTLNLCYYGVDHTPHCTAARTHHVLNGDILSRRITDEQTSPLASLKARWPAEQISRKARRFTPFAQECVSVPPGLDQALICAHGTTILTNREPSELVGERIFYALQVRTRTIL